MNQMEKQIYNYIQQYCSTNYKTVIGWTDIEINITTICTQLNINSEDLYQYLSKMEINGFLDKKFFASNTNSKGINIQIDVYKAI